MPSTYSSLKFELIGTGDQAGDWGNTTNVNFGTAVEQAISGIGNPVFTSDADLTLTLSNTNELQTARALVLNVTSDVSLTATRTLTVPAIEKQYLVNNNTSGAQSILVKTPGGTGVVVPNGENAHLYVNGADVTDAVTFLSSLALASPLPVTSGGTGVTAPSLVPGANVTVSGAFPNQTVSSFPSYVQNVQTGDYTLVLSDAGKQIFHPASAPLQSTYTIPANSVVPFPIGTQVLMTSENGGRTVFVACDDTLVFGSGTTGTVPLLPNNTLVCIKVTETKWMANDLYQTGVSNPPLESVAIGSSPAIVYALGEAGFETRYTNPTTGWPASALGVAFSPTGQDIALVGSATPFVTVFPFTVQGYGTKYADPSTLPPSQGNGVAFSNAGDALALAHSITPFVTVYPWSGAGFGTKYANPGTVPASQGNAVAFSPADDYIAVAHNGTPFIAVYEWSSVSGFGNKSANPGILPAGAGTAVTFTPTGNAIAVAQTTTPFISVYPFTAGVFGTRFTSPSTLPTGAGNGVAFHPEGNAIAVAHAVTPWMSVYNWSVAGFGTRFANPGTIPTGIGNKVRFSPSGDRIGVAHAVSPFVSLYAWSGTGFGLRVTNPSPLPSTTGTDIAFTVNP